MRKCRLVHILASVLQTLYNNEFLCRDAYTFNIHYFSTTIQYNKEYKILFYWIINWILQLSSSPFAFNSSFSVFPVFSAIFFFFFLLLYTHICTFILGSTLTSQLDEIQFSWLLCIWSTFSFSFSVSVCVCVPCHASWYVEFFYFFSSFTYSIVYCSLHLQITCICTFSIWRISLHNY